MLFKILFYSFGISSGVTALNVNSANATIRRNGYKINNDKLSFIEKLNYFITDYVFLLVPGYNLYKSIIKDKILTKPEVYAAMRKEKLMNRDILEDAHVSREPVRVVEETTEVAEEVKEEEPENKVLTTEHTQTNEVLFKTKQDEYDFYYQKLIDCAYQFESIKEDKSVSYEVKKAVYDKIKGLQTYLKLLKQSIDAENALSEGKKLL